MGIIGLLLLVIFALSAVLIVFFVLLQDDQGEGLGGLFGGGSTTPFGATGSSVLVKITSILGTIFIICSLGVAYVLRTPSDDDVLGEARRLEEGGGTEWWIEETAPEDTGSQLVIPQD